MRRHRPQFGRFAPGRVFDHRPGAHGLLFDARGALAVVSIGPEGMIDLPGGALDPGESAREACEREFFEETGLRVRAGAEIARAAQFAHLNDGRGVNKDCVYFEVVDEGAPGAPVEPDHRLAWSAPGEAVVRLRHDAHAWAVTVWLRRARRRGFA